MNAETNLVNLRYMFSLFVSCDTLEVIYNHSSSAWVLVLVMDTEHSGFTGVPSVHMEKNINCTIKSFFNVK